MISYLLNASNNPTADSEFRYVTTLLPANGTDGAINNIYIDSSDNNYTVTQSGTTTQSSFTPFSQPANRWSTFFDGTSDYLSFTANNSFAANTGAFTVESWINPTTTTTFGGVISQAIDAGSSGIYGYSISVDGASSSVVARITSRAATVLTLSGNSAPLGTWNHVCFVRNSSGNTSLFLNGVRQATAVSTQNMVVTGLVIGAYHYDNPTRPGFQFPGYISDARIVIGSAVYDPTLTTLDVPTTPLTAISNTVLLTCQTNRFGDGSANNITVTPNGDLRIRPFSPLINLSPYDKNINGGSVYLSGSGDYLSVADTANLRFGTQPFTIQAYVYRNVSGVAHPIAAKGASGSGWLLEITSANVLRFVAAATNIVSTKTIPAGEWVHVAAVRYGTGANEFQLLINGVVDATATVSTDFNQTTSLYIGTNAGITTYFNGHISCLKIDKGTPDAIVLPTVPPIKTANTQLLLNFVNIGIIDYKRSNSLICVGNTKIDTTNTKFGTGSIELDGSGDWLILPDNPDSKLGLSTFTIEFWILLSSADIGLTRGIISKGTSTTGWSVSLNSSQQIVFTSGVTDITSSGSITTDAWNHVAVVRAGTGTNQTKIYINGTDSGSGTVSDNFTQTNNMYIGANRVGSNPMKGYIDDVRITRGKARYSTSFTVPSESFPIQ